MMFPVSPWLCTVYSTSSRHTASDIGIFLSCCSCSKVEQCLTNLHIYLKYKLEDLGRLSVFIEVVFIMGIVQYHVHEVDDL